jgi:hypothetical protein
MIDRPCQTMGQDGQGFALAMLFLKTGQVLLALGVVAQKQHSRFREGPLQIGIADLFPRGARLLAG